MFSWELPFGGNSRGPLPFGGINGLWDGVMHRYHIVNVANVTSAVALFRNIVANQSQRSKLVGIGRHGLGVVQIGWQAGVCNLLPGDWPI